MTRLIAHRLRSSARPKNMPYNMAACDSSQSSYASGRLDFQPYFAGVDIERADCQDTVLNKLFRQWWKEAAIVYGFGDPLVLPVVGWDWPNHPVADLAAEANATDTGLKNGTKTLRQVYADNGDDFDIAVRQMAADYGLTEQQMRETLRLAVFQRHQRKQLQLGIAGFAQANVQRLSKTHSRDSSKEASNDDAP
jgi:hypothetical protein